MKLLLDTNIALDVLLAREPWLADAQGVWRACEEGQVTGYLLASTLTDIYYIARRAVGRDTAREAVGLCLATFAICAVDRAVLERALQLQGRDFEDDVQIAAAVEAGLDVIVTRNPADFADAPLPVLTPSALLARLANPPEQVEEGR
jgi:predicted nucleic acid-binding protein